MQALILVGGEGTRLRPLTESVPKSVMPLAGRPFLSYMIEWLGRHGVEEVVLACGYRADVVREVLGEGTSPRLRYVEEPEPRGTAGAIKFAAAELSDRFLALNGDVLTDLDLTALMDFHDRSGASATLGLYPVADASGYGLVTQTGEGEVQEFREKPAEPQPGEINAGTYALQHEVLDRIPDGEMVSIERDVFPGLIGEGLYAIPLEGYWMDIGTPDRYLSATWDILERRVETELGESLDEDGRLVAADAQLSDDAAIEGPALVMESARVQSGAKIGPRAVIGAGCEIGAGAAIDSSVLLEGCRIGERARVTGAILGAEVQVEAGAVIEAGSVIGKGERVG